MVKNFDKVDLESSDIDHDYDLFHHLFMKASGGVGVLT